MQHKPVWKITVLFLNPEGSRRFRSNPLAVRRTWMVDKENLGDNNMSSEQVERFHRRNSFHGLSHTAFLNSALPEAKKYSERKHVYIAIVIPPHIHKGKKKKKTRAIQVFLAFVFSPRCCQNNARPLSKISS